MNPIAKVLSIEKSLSVLINSKGLLDEDVQELYRRACADFENIILDDHQVDRLQEIEYQLWKLHYSHIEEFRKRIRQLTANAKDKKIKSSQDDARALGDLERHIDRFILYLSEATSFYDNLMLKFQSRFGLPSYFLSEKTGSSVSVESTKMNRVQYVCHRFLICLGDIARYKEFCRKSGARNWSIAAISYLEAARIWPHSGNPHNQLALLGTYVGDSFLSLYHCLRSLAVEEPFPDVWRNLMLLIEENRSSHLHFSSAEFIDFTRPHERILVKPTSEANSDSAKLDATENGPLRTDMWSLIVRLISFFLVSTSMEDFPHILASTVKELEDLESLEEADLQAAMVSYRHVTASKIGPHRGIQLVSMFIFILDSLIENSERERTTKNDEKDQFALTRLALATTFICIGRIIEACLKSKHLQISPLLPPVLIFLEWLVSLLDKVEQHTADDKVSSTMAYFFSVLAELQKQLDHGKKALTPDTALFEDHELRGFKPMAAAHRPLDFRTKPEFMYDFTCGYANRCSRILNASRKIVMRSKTLLNYDTNERKYVESMRCPGQRETEVVLACDSSNGKGVDKPKSGNDEERKGEITKGLNQSVSTTAATEEEEVILFKPIVRHNSAPLSSIGKPEDKGETPSEERLRRATSLIDEQNHKQSDSFSFYPDADNFNLNNNKLFKQQEHLFKDSTICAVGPPSLNAWVVNQGSPKTEREKGSRNHNKRELSPILEIASESLAELSINELKDPIPVARHVPMSTYNHPSAYVSPVPSAPLLPDDVVWSSGRSSVAQEVSRTVLSQEGDGILGASPLSGYLNYPAKSGPSDFNPRMSGMLDVQPPMMSSSEWLYHYRNSINLQRTSHHAFPVNVNSPHLLGAFTPNEVSRFGLLDQWGNYLVSDPMVNVETRQVIQTPPSYAPDVQIGNNPSSGYQRYSPPYPSNMGLPVRAEQPLLMQYLKDKEWHLKRDSQSGGSPKFYGT